MIRFRVDGAIRRAAAGTARQFTPEFIEAVRPCRHSPGGRWFVDETYVKVAGQWTSLYRAVDQYGQVIDVLLAPRRDLAAARHFFARALRAGMVPVEVTTDRAAAYPRALDELIPSALHIVEQYGSSPPDTPSSRISAAATTTSPLMSPPVTGSASHSRTSHSPSDQRSIRPCVGVAPG